MDDGVDLKRKRGTVTVLALLVSFLFGYAPATAQVSVSDARFGTPELVKRGQALRTAVRTSADDRDDDAALLPPPPRIVTALLALRPVAAPAAPVRDDAPQQPSASYRARAPPAA